MAETVGERLASVWARTDRIFEILAPEAILAQPIALRHPFIFYVGHLPAFAWTHICSGVLGRPSLNPAYDELFSRGIDPDVDDPSRCHEHPEIPDRWPALADVLGYRDRVRACVLESVDAVAERAPAHLMARGGRVFSMVIGPRRGHRRPRPQDSEGSLTEADDQAGGAGLENGPRPLRSQRGPASRTLIRVCRP